MAKKKKNRRRKSQRTEDARRTAPGVGKSTPDDLDENDGDELVVAHWQSTRSGARAGRGFHFQDAVGAWLAAGVAGGVFAEAQLIPEGLEDITLEGVDRLHVQVKSRVGYLGPFPPGQASRHILEAWDRHVERGVEGRLCLVLERGIRGHSDLSDLDQTLDEALQPGSAMRDLLMKRASESGLSADEVSRLMSTTAVVGPDWEVVTAETIRHLKPLVDLPPSAQAYLARELRIIVAEAADANADPDYVSRRSLSRTELVADIDRLVAHMDLDALESAVADGICEPFELPQVGEGDDTYYEGVATQPEHVSAGLVVPRPELMAEIVSGVQDRSAVVLTGPSGVGKSALLWQVPVALPGVLWYRIRRLADGDVSALIRLARTYAASPKAPVGFLVDAAGTGDFRGWARLRAEAAAVPGVLLVGTARIEDLAVLGDLSDCATVSVALNEKAAEVIHAGLVRRGATSSPHWREAFERSTGLTMEYTHLLTQGRRLGDVIADQIAGRIEEDRFNELELLSLISTADRWSATITMDEIVADMSVNRLELRKAVDRLAKEHLLVEKNGVLYGLHRLRSIAIGKAIHESPPPELADSVRRTLHLIPRSQVHRFVANLLRDEEWLGDTVLEVASTGPLDLDWIVGFVYGLRLSDLYAVAKIWKGIADRWSVPPSTQTLLFAFAISDLDFPDFFAEELRSALDEISQVTGPANREQLVARLGTDALARLLVDAASTADAGLLLAALDGMGAGLTTAVAEQLDQGSSLARALVSASLAEVGECLAVARSCDQTVADLLLSSIGGQEAILERIRRENPWVTAIDIRDEDGVTIGYARVLHVSDEVQGDPRERAVDLGRLLLRCLPGIDSVDVQALLPGGHEIRLGDYTHGTSGLQRRYDRPTMSTAWNQASVRAAFTLVAHADTSRLADALPLLGEASDITRDLGTILVGMGSRISIQVLDARIAELHRRANLLRPSLGSVELGDTAIGQEAGVPFNDDLSALLTALTGNVYRRLHDRDGYPALAAYLSDTVRGRHLEGVYREPWHLIGIEGHPESLEELSSVLDDVNAVVEALASGTTDEERILRSARSGSRRRALERAAETCRRDSRRRVAARRRELAETCSSTGLRAQVVGPGDGSDPKGANEVTIAVELDSLVEWANAAHKLQEALNVIRMPAETFTFIPLRNGRPVPSLTLRLISSLWPTPGLGGRESELEFPHPSDLADSFDAASLALQTLSGISELDPKQQAHSEVQDAISNAASEYQSARERLAEFGPDALTQELIEVVDTYAMRVQGEFDGTASGPRFAERVVAGAMQVDDTDEHKTIVGGRVLALEWDIDRATALGHLDDPE